MGVFTRYAVYDAPRCGVFADRVSRWLGRDCATGLPVSPDGPKGLARPQMALTDSPRRYGFHGTLKAPFRLAPGIVRADLSARLAHLAQRLSSVEVAAGLSLRDLGGWLALVPKGDEGAINRLAADVMRGLDDLRAPLDAAEIARRDPASLTPHQRALLLEWGYPYVLDQFRFHLTLTDMLPADEAAALIRPLAEWLAPVLPRPYLIRDLCLFGEAVDGQFYLLERHSLTG